MFEKIPFLHRNRAYNIIIDDDLTFEVLHCLLDELIERGAFEVLDDFADLYTIEHSDTEYTIGVDGFNVMIVIK
ncbi:MAG: hypothetical protein JW920_05080 [Deltaproteobacteria bacterium]|nr:hypothetical protein [Deltaproteobacteria bacterium]